MEKLILLVFPFFSVLGIYNRQVLVTGVASKDPKPPIQISHVKVNPSLDKAPQQNKITREEVVEASRMVLMGALEVVVVDMEQMAKILILTCTKVKEVVVLEVQVMDQRIWYQFSWDLEEGEVAFITIIQVVSMEVPEVGCLFSKQTNWNAWDL